MMPAHQRFKASNAVLAKIEKRLIKKKKLVPLDCRSQIELKRATLPRRCIVTWLKEADRARARFLRAIERNVGMLQKIVRRFAVAGRQTYADAGGADDFMSLNQERMVKSGDNFLGKFERLIQLRYICRNQSKLVPAYTRSDIGISRRPSQCGCELGEKFISGKMTELVVDFLEPIKVEQKNGTLLAIANQPGQSGFQAFVEGETVRKLGERILPHSLFGFEMSDHPPCELERISKNDTQKHTRINNNQNCDQPINKVAASGDADCRAKKNRSHEANGRNRNGCKCESATCQHAGAQAGHQHLPARICLLKEANGNNRPHAAQNEGVSHKPMNGTPRHRLRLGNPPG